MCSLFSVAPHLLRPHGAERVIRSGANTKQPLTKGEQPTACLTPGKSLWSGLVRRPSAVACHRLLPGQFSDRAKVSAVGLFRRAFESSAQSELWSRAENRRRDPDGARRSGNSLPTLGPQARAPPRTRAPERSLRRPIYSDPHTPCTRIGTTDIAQPTGSA